MVGLHSISLSSLQKTEGGKKVKLDLSKGLFYLVALYLSFSSILLAQEEEQEGLLPPEKIQELEEHREWQDPEEVLDRLRLQEGYVVADIGAGAGYFTIPLAKKVGPEGLVYAEEIQQALVDYLEKKVETLGITNVKIVLGKPTDTTLPRNTLDLALLVNTYHQIRQPQLLLVNIRQILKSSGKLVIIDWRPEREAPVGPPKEYKVSEYTVIKEAKDAGFQLFERHTYMPYHYFLIFRK